MMKLISNQTERKSGIELLRILAMLMIVGHHYSVHGGFAFSTNQVTIQKLWIDWLSLGGKIGVNIFMLISGYFLINTTEVNITKIAKFWGQVICYSFGFSVLFYFTRIDGDIGLKTVIKSLFPLSSTYWWYATSYFVIYLLCPYINTLLKTIGKHKHLYLIVCTTILFCLSNIFIFIGGSFHMSDTAWLIYLYIVAAYIRLYKDDVKINHCMAYGTISYIITFITSVVLSFLGRNLPILANVSTYYFGMNKLPVLVTSILLFMAFKNLNVKYNKFINIIASTTFGIYLIHDHKLVRHYLWITLLNNATYSDSIIIFTHAVTSILAVFVVCGIIEFIRIYSLERLWIKILSKSNPKLTNINNRVKSHLEKLI